MTQATLAAANAQQKSSAGWYGSTGGVAGCGAAANSAVASESAGGIHRTILNLAAVSATITKSASAGYGSLKIYDFPQGVIQIFGTVADLDIVAASGIGATATVACSIGTGANADTTLSATEVDLVPSGDVVLAASAGTFAGKSTATEMAAGVFDGTATAKDLCLNFALAAGVSTNSSLALTGTVTVTWVNLGDL